MTKIWQNFKKFIKVLTNPLLKPNLIIIDEICLWKSWKNTRVDATCRNMLIIHYYTLTSSSERNTKENYVIIIKKKLIEIIYIHIENIYIIINTQKL